jgi:hypothetical protein
VMEFDRESIQMEVEKVRQRLKKPCLMFNPESKFSRRWFGLNVLFLLFTALVTPYEVALLESDVFTLLWWINRVVDLYFFTDIFIQFNLAYVKPNSNKLVTSRYKIVRRYMRTFFFPDLVSVVPFDLMAEYAQGNLFSNFQTLRALRLLRLLKLVRVIKASAMLGRCLITLS